MDINEILSQLGLGSKETVYLSVTPGIGLELIQLDMSTKSVKNYAFRPLDYNESLREITDYDAFKDYVVELFQELNVGQKPNVILNMPMVLFGSKELPLLLADEAITEALTSEVEQSYIFKRYEPVVSWSDSNASQSGDMRKLFYSAIQKNAIDSITTALNEIGATLVGVEISLTSILKALAFSGRASDLMKENMSWNLMLINQSGYSIVSMIGKNIVDYYEEPLPIRSLEGDEIYSAINASAQITLMSYPANTLFIVSETDMVSAEILANRLQVDGTVQFWENNQFKKQDFVPVSLEVLEDNAKRISLEAIGIAVGNEINMPIKFNFAASSGSESAGDDDNSPLPVNFGGKEIQLTPIAARNMALVFALLILLPAFGAFFGIPMIEKQKQAQLDDLKGRIDSVNAEIKRLEDLQNKSNNFDANAEIKKVLGNNRIKLMSYSAIGQSVPKKLWATYFVAKDDGKIDIKGEAENVEDVYSFFKNMKDSLIDTKLRIHKLQMKTDSVDDAVILNHGGPVNYEFEITNMSAGELNTPQANDQNQQNQQNQNPADGNKQ